METLLQTLNWASHLVWPFFVFVVLIRHKLPRWLVVALIALGLVFVYARYVERYWIKETHIDLNRGWGNRVVLIADQHLGVFKTGHYMQRVVDRINQIDDVDFVVIAGDFTFWPQDMIAEHSPLAQLNVPTYAVMGNHDVMQSGHISNEIALRKILEQSGVTVLHNDIAHDTGVTIYGLGNHWSHTDDVSLLAQSDPDRERILILTHNPDTTRRVYPDVDLSDSITLTGHTHCGQIRIPWLYKMVIPTRGDFPDQGPYDLGHKGTLIITCGLGEIGLPLRLFNRPEIMVIDM